MKNDMRLMLLIITSIFSSSINADNRLIIHLRHAPEVVISQAEREAKKQSLSKKITHNITTKTPGNNSIKLVKNSIRSHFKPPLSGFAATYAGYHDISNPDGLIAFPLRHATPKLFVAITPHINMITVKGNTTSHLEYSTNKAHPVKIFQYELKKNDLKQSYWQVSPAQVPADRKVNPITLIIFTKPDNLYIPSGDFITQENVQLIIPDIYVLSRSSHEETLLQQLDWQKNFERIEQEKKKISDAAYQLMIKNL